GSLQRMVGFPNDRRKEHGLSRSASILTGCTVAMLLAAVGASSAYALFTEGVECKTETGAIEAICITSVSGGVLLEAVGTEKISKADFDEGTVGLLLVPSLSLELESTLAVCLECEVLQASPLTVLGTIDGVIDFENVKVVGTLEPKCEILNKTVTTKALVAQGANETEVEINPASGKTFAELEIGNKGTETCPATVKGIN